jgi:hypothetical protein
VKSPVGRTTFRGPEEFLMGPEEEFLMDPLEEVEAREGGCFGGSTAAGMSNIFPNSPDFLMSPPV